MHATQEYLEEWAEPEAALARSIEGAYERTLVVPVCAADPAFLDGYLDATQTSRGRTLAVLVVHGPEDGAPSVHEENRRLLEGLRGKLKRVKDVEGPVRAFSGTVQLGNLDVVVVDRSSAGLRVARQEGAGLARKIGADLALSLHAAGRVRSRYLFGADADTKLPEAHFDLPAVDDREGLAAAVFPFWHEAGADVEVTRRTALQELSLRYYVAGLGQARSPYAFHTLSSVAVTAEAYAAVRGYPKRGVAESFYLLNKIAKVGSIVRLPGSPVRIRPWASRRAGSDAAAGTEPVFHAPDCFRILSDLIVRLNDLAEHGSTSRFFSSLSAIPEPARAVVHDTLAESEAEKALSVAAGESPTAYGRRLRIHGWFDAVRTRKLLDALRERTSPALSWQAALAAAPFCPAVDFADGPGLLLVRHAFALKELRGPLFLGPWETPWDS